MSFALTLPLIRTKGPGPAKTVFERLISHLPFSAAGIRHINIEIRGQAPPAKMKVLFYQCPSPCKREIWLHPGVEVPELTALQADFAKQLKDKAPLAFSGAAPQGSKSSNHQSGQCCKSSVSGIPIIRAFLNAHR